MIFWISAFILIFGWWMISVVARFKVSLESRRDPIQIAAEPQRVSTGNLRLIFLFL